METRKNKLLTQCVQAGSMKDKNVGAVITPIYTASSYEITRGSDHFCYPRYQNVPTQTATAGKIAALENGDDALILGSGMAAISTALLSILKAGDHAVIQRNIYGGTFHLVEVQLPNLGIEYTLVDGESLDEFARAIRPETKLIYFETPTNPLLSLVDIQAVVDLAQSKGLVTVIDNTFATPVNQRPLDMGVDIVIHSATKYLGGHSDLCSGVVVASRDFIDQAREVSINIGGILGPFECYLLERSMKTLALRVAQHNKNAMTLAQFLKEHPRIRKVYYPGLEDHPGHEIAKKQMTGFGGMLTMDIDGGQDDALAVVDRLNLFQHAVSLGGVESLVSLPILTSHAKMPAAERKNLGITDSLVRVSVGVEDPDDLVADMKSALEK